MAQARKTTSNATQEEKMWGVASYFWIVSILVLLLRRNSKYVQGHAKQGLLLFIGESLAIIPGIGWLIALISVILAVVGIIKALNGEEWQIPFVGEAWAKKINL